MEVVVLACGVPPQAEKSTIKPPSVTRMVFQRIAIPFIFCLHCTSTGSVTGLKVSMDSLQEETFFAALLFPRVDPLDKYPQRRL